MSDLDSIKLHTISETHSNIIKNIKRIFAKSYMLEHQLKLNDALYHYHRVLEFANLHNLFHSKAHIRVAKINLTIGRPQVALKHLRTAYLHNFKLFNNSKKIYEDSWKKTLQNLNKSLDRLDDLKINFKNAKAKTFASEKIEFFNKHVLIFESLPVRDKVLSVGVKKLKYRMQNALKNYKKQFMQVQNKPKNITISKLFI